MLSKLSMVASEGIVPCAFVLEIRKTKEKEKGHNGTFPSAHLKSV